MTRHDDAAGAAPHVSAEWMEWSGDTALAILKRLQERRWAGWDPYDALNATRFRRVLHGSSIARRCAAQAVNEHLNCFGYPAQINLTPAVLLHANK